MPVNLLRAGALSCALLTSTALVPPAHAAGTPAYRNLDANGVDLTHGDFLLNMVEGSIGSGADELALMRLREGNSASQWDNITYTRRIGVGGAVNVTIGLGTRFEQFLNGASVHASGSTLVGTTYVAANGTQIEFGDPTGAANPDSTPFCNDIQQSSECRLLPLTITFPDRRATTLTWNLLPQCDGYLHPIYGVETCSYSWRLEGLGNTAGYRIAFVYGTGSIPAWFQRTGAEFFNDAVSAAPQGSVSYSEPTFNVLDITDMAGQAWRVSGYGANVSVRRPGAPADTLIYSGFGQTVSSVVNEGVPTYYSRSVAGSTATTTVTNALNQQSTVVSDMTIGRPTSVTDPLGRTTSFQYDGNGRLTRQTAPEGNAVQYTRDSRGNVSETRLIAKPGSGAADIVTSAAFPSFCGNPVTCNQPTSTTDARGNVTDYTYDATHGGVLTVTAPAPTPGATRPETRYVYGLINGEYRLTATSTCQTGAAPACVGTAEEVRTTVSYGTNDRVVSTSTGAGDGSLTATTAMTYTPLGDVASLDGPLPGSADTSYARYDAGRRQVGAIGPDPDGAGPQPHRASRVTYTNGLPVLQETGTVTDPSDAAWAAFSSAEQVATDYDGNARPVAQRLIGGGNTYAMTQTSYDALGRPECQTVRMNPSAFASAPGACSLGTQGSYGPDRITRASYNAAGEVIEMRSGVGTAAEGVDAASTYTPSGQVQTLTDGENNRTTYEYDGHDRLAVTRYPITAQGGLASSGSDYEQLGYDPAGNVTSRRLRDGNTIGMSYDALNRLTFMDRPNIDPVVGDPDYTYQYDLTGRLTRISDPNGYFNAYGYDALGRVVTEGDVNGSNTNQYDLAGRRTRLAHPDGFAVDYTYRVTGELASVTDNVAGTVASFGYDHLGRRTALTRGNGAVTSYAYDPVSRLSSLSHDLGGTAHDVGFGYSHNPAGQIVEGNRSNDAYRFNANSASVGNAHNGLNQITTSGGASFAHDGRGNTTFNGQRTFRFDSLNRLTGAPSTFSSYVYYTPAGRLNYVNMAGSSVRSYSGDALAREWGASPSRHVFGVDATEPLLSYDLGTGAREWLHADERGSVIALSGAGGAATAINAYDDDGRSQSSTGGTLHGRFGYTGQAFVPELGLYDYRARMYDPGAARFTQPDPIGYTGGLNTYSYAWADPVNFRDPSGLLPDETVTGRPNRPRRGGGGGIIRSSGGAVAQLDMPLQGDDGGGPSSADQPRTDEGCPSAPSSRPVGNVGTIGTALRDPLGVYPVIVAKDQALAAAAREYPNLTGINDLRDAFRHVYWVAAMTRLLGPSRALAFANAHEADYPLRGQADVRSRAMDTFNNYVAIRMAVDPRQRGVSTADIARRAISRGCVRTAQ